MRDFIETDASKATTPYPAQRSAFDASLWCAFGSGVIVAMAAMYLAVARPIADQLERLETRMAEVDRNLRTVAGHRGDLKRSNDVLSALAEQGRRSEAAADGLERIRGLHDQLAAQTADFERALTALENLSALKNSLLQKAPQLENATAILAGLGDMSDRLASSHQLFIDARRALGAAEKLSTTARSLERPATVALFSLDQVGLVNQRLIEQEVSTQAAARTLESLVALKERARSQQAGLPEAQTALQNLVDLKCRVAAEEGNTEKVVGIASRWADMQNRLITSGQSLPAAQLVSEELIGLQSDLVYRASDRPAARAALESLIAIRERLDAQSPGIDTAHDHVEELIGLKNKVLAQTSNLAGAIETIELTNDLYAQLEQAIRSFSQIRHAMIEIMAFEPAVERATNMLEPLTALGNLRHMTGGDLRDVARILRDQRKPEANRVQVAPATKPDVVGPSAFLPPSPGAPEAK